MWHMSKKKFYSAVMIINLWNFLGEQAYESRKYYVKWLRLKKNQKK